MAQVAGDQLISSIRMLEMPSCASKIGMSCRHSASFRIRVMVGMPFLCPTAQCPICGRLHRRWRQPGRDVSGVLDCRCIRHSEAHRHRLPRSAR